MIHFYKRKKSNGRRRNGAARVLEFNFDNEERPMFEFDPQHEYIGLLGHDGHGVEVVMTYQALARVTEMTVRLLQAWEKRAAVVDHLERQELSQFGSRV